MNQPGTPNLKRRALSLVELTMLLGSVVAVSFFGAAAHRWMWEQAALLSYRTTMNDLTTTVRATQVKALASHQAFELRVDAPRGCLQLVAISNKHGGSIEHVERTIWLPHGLEISDAPAVVRVSPRDATSSTSIVVMAPAYSRLFRIQTNDAGLVQLHEEPTL
jgi:hypothetical protein